MKLHKMPIKLNNTTATLDTNCIWTNSNSANRKASEALKG